MQYLLLAIINNEFLETFINMIQNKKSLKYIARKGSELDLEDLKEGYKSFEFKKTINLIDSIFFKNPPKFLAFLILIVILPISLYLTLRRESEDIGTQAFVESEMYLSSANISNFNLNKIEEITFNVNTYGIKSIDFIEIRSPEWFIRGDETEKNYNNNESLYKTITYSGKVISELDDKFVLLVRGSKKDIDIICNGCDKDQKYLYGLYDFNINSNACSNLAVYGRYPLGFSKASDNTSYCSKFNNDCIIPASWKSFESKEECLSYKNKPDIIKVPENKIYTFNVDCNGDFDIPSQKINETIEALDTDGEIVRFNIISKDDFISLRQDSTETIVRELSKMLDSKYESYKYTGVLYGEIQNDLIGKTTSVTVNACDLSNDCASRDFEISAFKRSNCDFLLPETGASITVRINTPEPNAEFRGLENIVLTLSGSNLFDVKVDLYNENCQLSTDFISNIASYNSLRLNGEKGIAVSFDSRLYNDNRYCIKVFARNATTDTTNSNWQDFASQIFEIRNVNQDPYFLTNPSDTNLITGESFDYTFEALDPDGDELNYDVIGVPDWLRIENRRIFGTTSIPGSYNFVVFVDDNHKGYATQQITINVSPPANQSSQINIIFPTINSVLGGSDNQIRWQVGDNEGVYQVQLYYSQDQRQWNLIGTFGSDVNETNWDTSSLENGIYYFMLVVTDASSQNVQTTRIIGPIYIANEEEEEQTTDGDIIGEDTSMPSINNLTPEPDIEIDSKKPLISASLHPSNNAKIDLNKVEVFLDDEKINSICKISEIEVICELTNEIEAGKHKIKISITDTKDKSITEEWYFSIIEITQEETQSVQEGNDTILIPGFDVEISRNVIIISLALFCSALILIFIPWFIYFLLNKRLNRRQELQNLQSSYTQKDVATNTGTDNINSYYPSYPQSDYQPQNQYPTYQDPNLTSQSQPQSQSQSQVNSESLPHGYSPQSPTTDDIN